MLLGIGRADRVVRPYAATVSAQRAKQSNPANSYKLKAFNSGPVGATTLSARLRVP